MSPFILIWFAFCLAHFLSLWNRNLAIVFWLKVCTYDSYMCICWPHDSIVHIRHTSMYVQIVYSYMSIWGFPSIEVPQNGWFIDAKFHDKKMIWGVPSILRNQHSWRWVKKPYPDGIPKNLVNGCLVPLERRGFDPSMRKNGAEIFNISQSDGEWMLINGLVWREIWTGKPWGFDHQIHWDFRFQFSHIQFYELMDVDSSRHFHKWRFPQINGAYPNRWLISGKISSFEMDDDWRYPPTQRGGGNSLPNGHGMISWSLGALIPKAQLKAWMPWCSWGQRITLWSTSKNHQTTVEMSVFYKVNFNTWVNISCFSSKSSTGKFSTAMPRWSSNGHTIIDIFHPEKTENHPNKYTLELSHVWISWLF